MPALLLPLAFASFSLAASATLGTPLESPAAAPHPATTAPVLLPEGFKDQIDHSIRWLRAQQDPVTGTYGGNVEGTAWVLRALAVSPRGYRVTDGPFVRRASDFLVGRQGEDGSIADEGAEGQAAVQQTRLATWALLALDHADYADEITGAMAFLGEHGVEDLDGFVPTGPASVEEARALGQHLLSQRNEKGAFEGEGGAVLATGKALVRLSAAHAVLDRASGGSAARTSESLPDFEPAQRDAVLKSMLRGADFLVGVAQDGRFGAPGEPDPGITAMVIASLASLPEPRPEKVQSTIDAGLAWLLSLQHEDGSIHDGKLQNYVTSAAIQALTRAGDESHREAILAARTYLQGLQADEGEGYSEGDLYYGGIGYGGDERPDLSNLQMALEALAMAELDSDDPTFKKALRFLERCQNRSESNDVKLVKGEATIESGNDGGAGYAPGDSKAGFVELADGRKVPRSYGSMTYALLKCYVFAGLEKSDPRMQAAWEWCCKNYTLDLNPGFEASTDPTAAYQGLFYYFSGMARALDVYGAPMIVDAEGNSHDWRADICGRMIAMQSRLDGSWVNHNSPRWYEGNPLLATSYALLTLDAALPEAD